MRLKTRVLAAVSTMAIAGGVLAFAAPAATADTPAGSCTGGQSLGKIVPPLGDQTQRVTVGTALLKNLATNTVIGGSCSGLVNAFDDPTGGGPVPTIHPKANASKLSGVASCATGATATAVDATKANAFPLTGKDTITATELNALGKNWQIQAYLTVKGFDPAAADVVEITGLIAKGPSLGATVGGKLYEDPVSKAPATKPPSGNGYQLDISQAIGCADGTPNNATIATVQVGDGTSLLGNPASGLSFSYIAAT